MRIYTAVLHHRLQAMSWRNQFGGIGEEDQSNLQGGQAVGEEG